MLTGVNCFKHPSPNFLRNLADFVFWLGSFEISADLSALVNARKKRFYCTWYISVNRGGISWCLSFVTYFWCGVKLRHWSCLLNGYFISIIIMVKISEFFPRVQTTYKLNLNDRYIFLEQSTWDFTVWSCVICVSDIYQSSNSSARLLIWKRIKNHLHCNIIF